MRGGAVDQAKNTRVDLGPFTEALALRRGCPATSSSADLGDQGRSSRARCPLLVGTVVGLRLSA